MAMIHRVYKIQIDPKVTISETIFNFSFTPFLAPTMIMLNRGNNNINMLLLVTSAIPLCRGRRDHVPPKITPTSHINKAPEPRFQSSTNLNNPQILGLSEKKKKDKIFNSLTQNWSKRVKWVNLGNGRFWRIRGLGVCRSSCYRRSIIIKLRLRSEVSENEETCECCRQEYEDDPQRTHSFFFFFLIQFNSITCRNPFSEMNVIDPGNKKELASSVAVIVKNTLCVEG